METNGRPYKVRIMKTGKIVTGIGKHVQTTAIFAEQYLRDHISEKVAYLSAEMTYTEIIFKILSECTCHKINTQI